MVLTTDGLSSGFCVDPIEKKPLFHFYPGCSVLSFGTAGCNLACAFCQNHEISKSREVDTSAQKASPEAIARAAVELGCAWVAFTYNDPVIFYEYAIDVAAACHARGVKTVAVTAGYIIPGAARRVLSRRSTPPTSTSRRSPRTSIVARRRASRAGARHAEISPPRDRGVAGDHDAADPRRERFARGDRRADALGRATNSAPRRRCISPPSIPITACRPSADAEGDAERARAQAEPTASSTSMSATSAIARARRPIAPAAARH